MEFINNDYVLGFGDLELIRFAGINLSSVQSGALQCSRHESKFYEHSPVFI